jgi:beta-phosphoglucomutase
MATSDASILPARAILWDLDGVIVDSGPYHYESFRRLFADRGHELTERRFFGELFGLRNEVIFRTMLGALSPEQTAELAREKEETYRELVAGNVEALPAARELIGRAREAGLLQAIVSSTPGANVDVVLGSLGIADAFNAIVAEEDASHGKPDPEGFLVAATRLGVPPSACVVIEDAPEGITAGNEAGARTIGVATTRPPERLVHATLVVETLEDERVWRFIANAAP